MVRSAPNKRSFRRDQGATEKGERARQAAEWAPPVTLSSPPPSTGDFALDAVSGTGTSAQLEAAILASIVAGMAGPAVQKDATVKAIAEQRIPATTLFLFRYVVKSHIRIAIPMPTPAIASKLGLVDRASQASTAGDHGSALGVGTAASAGTARPAKARSRIGPKVFCKCIGPV